MTPEGKKECDRELKRLAKMTPASAEYMVSRTYLEWMTSLPWSKSTGMHAEEIDIKKAHDILNEDHYDLEKVKERILDYMAVKKLQPGMKGPILCFVGPPGVEKLHWENRSREPWAANSCASRWGECTMKQKFAGIAAPTSAPCPDRSYKG